jgi:hypothetical protein
VAGPSLATREWNRTKPSAVQKTPRANSDPIASMPGAASGMCISPSGSRTTAATSCVPVTVATGSRPGRLRLRYQAPTA